MFRVWKNTALLLIVSIMVTACAGGNAGQGTQGRNSTDGPLFQAQEVSPFPDGAVTPLDSTHQPTSIPFVTQNGKKFIPLDTIANMLDFENVTFDPATGVEEIGDKDVLFRLTAGSKEAEKAGLPFTMSEAPTVVNGRMMLPVSVLTDLFQEEMVFEVTADGIAVYPSDTQATGRDNDGADEEVDDSLDFSDDPNDPFAGGDESAGAFEGEEAEETTAALETLEALAADPEAVPALKNININALIRTSKRYLGVKYKFGAGPYPRTNRFDCSSYTQYVFGKYGVKLPRTARAQANVGKTVSRKNLRKGDLLYFYVPGRFKSNKTIGHVGIYIGNGTMIHANTEPKNGVQLRSINRAFWKKTFIRAKRVAY